MTISINRTLNSTQDIKQTISLIDTVFKNLQDQLNAQVAVYTSCSTTMPDINQMKRGDLAVCYNTSGGLQFGLFDGKTLRVIDPVATLGVTSNSQNFTFSSIGDTSGVVFSRVANGTSPLVLRSSNIISIPESLIDRDIGYTSTDNNPGEWFALDLGPSVSLILSKYTLQMALTNTTHSPRTWKMQGSNDVAWTISGVSAATWIDLDIRINDATIHTSDWNGVFTANNGVTTPFRYLRFLNTGANLAGINYIQVAEVEFYGTAFLP